MIHNIPHTKSDLPESLKTRCTILIVDDEASWLQTLSLAFRARGFKRVLACQDGYQALDLLSRETVDLLLLDLVMPKVSGTDLLPKITEKFPDLPVIVLSGMMQAGDQEWGKGMGLFGQCVKTDPQETLFGLVERALNARGEHFVERS